MCNSQIMSKLVVAKQFLTKKYLRQNIVNISKTLYLSPMFGLQGPLGISVVLRYA